MLIFLCPVNRVLCNMRACCIIHQWINFMLLFTCFSALAYGFCLRNKCLCILLISIVLKIYYFLVILRIDNVSLDLYAKFTKMLFWNNFLFITSYIIILIVLKMFSVFRFFSRIHFLLKFVYIFVNIKLYVYYNTLIISYYYNNCIHIQLFHIYSYILLI